MMSTAKLAEWESVASYPDANATNLIQISSTEFICGSFSKNKNIILFDDPQKILKFSIITNKWTEFLTLPEELSCIGSSYMCLDQNKQTLYISIHDANQDPELEYQIIAFNLKTKEHTQINLPGDGGSVGPLLSIPNSGIHYVRCIGGKHSVLKENQITPEELCCYCPLIKYSNISNLQSVYLQTKKEIYTFGGFGTGASEPQTQSLDTIFSYNIETLEHKLLDLKIPESVDTFACVKTNDERYVITFGGLDTALGTVMRMNDLDTIYIFDMVEMTVRESNIKCPREGMCEAILMGNRAQQRMIVNGYIRRCWTLTEFDGVSYLSIDVMNLIFEWFVEEMIYLLDKSQDAILPSGNKLMWRISLADILRQCATSGNILMSSSSRY